MNPCLETICAIACLGALVGCGRSSNSQRVVDFAGRSVAAVNDEVSSDTLAIGSLQAASAATPAGGTLKRYNPNAIPGMARTKNKGYVFRPAVWAQPAIAVCWETMDPMTSMERKWVEDAVTRTWDANSSNLRFFGWDVACSSRAAGIRIAVADTGPHTKGLGNQLNKTANGMVLNFSFENWSPSCRQSELQRKQCIESIAVHEFGHALAFAHEQNRPDTPGECAEQRQGPNGTEMLTPWDLNSVMNYCNPVYNNHGVLSDGDLKSLWSVYGR